MASRKKTLRFSIIALAFGATAAHAEHRLFPTDILDKGEIDLLFTYGQYRHSQPVVFTGHPGTQKQEISFETVEVRYGFGSNWLVGASLQHDSTYRVRTDFPDIPLSATDTSDKGFQNPLIWAKYRFIGGDDAPFSIAGFVATRPNTTGNAPATLEGGLVGGWNLGDGLKIYTGYDGVKPETSRYGASHTISVGGHKSFGNDLTLTAEIYWKHGQASDFYTSYNNRSASVSALLQLLPNTYLRPHIAVGRLGENSRQDGIMRWDRADSHTVAVSLYHLF